MIGIVLGPLGLPVEAVLIVMMAVDAVIDPMRTFLIVYVNIAATALIVRRTAATVALQVGLLMHTSEAERVVS
jgi:Na+/H+-dicarboxylate symporter